MYFHEETAEIQTLASLVKTEKNIRGYSTVLICQMFAYTGTTNLKMSVNLKYGNVIRLINGLVEHSGKTMPINSPTPAFLHIRTEIYFS